MLGFRLLGRLVLGHQVDGPLRQLGSQAHVLAVATDGNGQVVLVDHDVHGVLFLIDDDGGNLGRRQRADDELRRIGRPQHDVDVLAADFVAHGSDARAAQADAGTDRIDARVVRLDGNLGAQAGVAGTGLQFHQTIGDFRHFQLEQLDDEFRSGTRQDDLRATGIAIDAQQISLDTVADTQVFLGNHLVARQQGFDLAGFDDGVAALHALDGTGNDMFTTTQEVGQYLLALGVANLLQNDLLGGLGTDTAEIDRLQRLLQVIAGFDLRIVLLGIGQRHLQVFVDVFVVGNNLPTTEGVVVTRIAVDGNTHFGFVVDTLFRRRSERQLKGTENDFLGDVLFAGQCIDQQQHFTAHGLKPPSPSVESGHQTCLLDIGKFQFHIIFIKAQTDLTILAAQQLALEVTATVVRNTQLDLDILAGKTLEIGRLLDDAIHARRRDFEAIKIDVLDLEHARQLIRHLGAIIDIDTVFLGWRINEDANRTAARRQLDIDEFIAHTNDGGFQQRV